MTHTEALEALTALARPRYGVFTTDDALAIGVTPAMLTYYTKNGRFRRFARSIYALAGDSADWRQPLMAAQVWGGPDAVLAGPSAAALMDLDGVSRKTTPALYTPRWRSHPEWTVHRGRPNPEHVVACGRFLRHTDALQTLLDLARPSASDDDRLEIIAESALRTHQLTDADLRLNPRLDELARRRPEGAPATQSELETRMVQLLRRTGLPVPARQYPVMVSPAYTVYLDLAFPDACLFIETDGRAFHSGTSVLRDRHRQNAIVRELGWIPLRFGWSDVVERPRHTAREVERCYHQARQRITEAAGGRAPAHR
jgi:very-short-patch-repair endonuclease